MHNVVQKTVQTQLMSEDFTPSSNKANKLNSVIVLLSTGCKLQKYGFKDSFEEYTVSRH